MDKGKCGNWTALIALVAAVIATASTPVLAEKGGRGPALGVPDVDLGLSKIQGAGVGAGPFVPSPQLHVAPGLMRGPLGNGNVPGTVAPGASGLTPASGMTPPGHLATPGLRLGNGNTNGAMQAAPDAVQPGNGNGLALGYRDDNGSGTAKGAVQGPVAATDRVAPTSQVADRDALESSGTMRRQLPICR